MSGTRWSALRAIILNDNPICAYCKDEPATEADHDIPRARGGSDEAANLIPSCRPCNGLKGMRTAVEFRDYLATSEGQAAVVAVKQRQAMPKSEPDPPHRMTPAKQQTADDWIAEQLSMAPPPTRQQLAMLQRLFGDTDEQGDSA